LNRNSSASKKARSSKSSKSSRMAVTENGGVGATDLSALSDDELFQQLVAHGLAPGPIVASTRPFYERKLGRLLGQEPELEVSKEEEYSDTEPEEEDDQPSAVVQPEKRTTRSSTRSPGSPGESEVRLRLGGKSLKDEIDGSFSESQESGGGVSPRRSIHSYKVTEVKRQVVRRDREGKETRDTFHTVTREENDGSATSGAQGKSGSWASSMVKLLVVLLLVLGLVLVLSGALETLTTAKDAEEVLEAISAAQEGPTPPVQREAAQEQPSITDV